MKNEKSSQNSNITSDAPEQHHHDTSQLNSWPALNRGVVMGDFTNPEPSFQFQKQIVASSLDQIHDRVLSELISHERRSAHWEGSVEPNVELSLDEVRIMVGKIALASNLLQIA